MAISSAMPSGIKSIKRGVISIGTGLSSGTATITAVDMAKSELRFLGGNGLVAGGTETAIPKIVLTNSTTITATIHAISNNANVSWELTERW